MLPYIWPKGSVVLQLTVVTCLIILGAGRVLNVFVPLYSKYIGESAVLGPIGFVCPQCPCSPLQHVHW